MNKLLVSVGGLGLFAAASMAAAQGDQHAAQKPNDAGEAKAHMAHRPSADAPLRQNVKSPNRYHAGVYELPQGYSRRQWNYGERLPAAYYARRYWLTNYLAYSLFSPPPGMIWVRVGDDAVLIEQKTGQIVQVRYSAFY